MKTFVKSIGILVAVCACPVFAKPPEVIDKVVAVVNDAVITQSQIDARIETFKKSVPPGAALPSLAEMRKKVLEEEVNLSLELQIAKTANITVTEQQVTDIIADIAKRNNLSMAELKQKITEEGVAYDNYVQEIHNQLIVHRLQQQELVPLIQVTPQEVRDYIKNTPPKVIPASSYHVVDYVIAVPEAATGGDIAQAKKSAQNVVTFLKLGKTVNDDDTVKSMDFGWKKLEELPELLQPTVAKLTANDVSEPIQAPNGMHILKVVEIEGGKPKDVQETHLRKILLKEDALNDANHIKQRLVQIRARLAAGGDFAKIAKEISQDPESRIDGGDIGWLKPGTYDPEIEAGVHSLAAGDVSAPIKTAQGWMLMKVEGRRLIQDKQALREVEAREAIFERKLGEKMKNWIQQARSQAYIDIKG